MSSGCATVFAEFKKGLEGWSQWGPVRGKDHKNAKKTAFSVTFGKGRLWHA